LFLRDGAVVLPLLDQAEVQFLLDAYWAAVPELDLGFHATMFSPDLEMRRRIDAAVQSVLTPKLIPYLADYRGVVGNCVVKEHSRAGTEVPVHQDWTFVDEAQMRSLNVWCPLVDTNSVNGALRIFKGSHQFLRVLRGPFFPNPYVDLADTIGSGYMTEVPLRAGEAIIYDHSLVHASPPNLSGKTRVAVNLVLVPREAQIIHCYLDRQDPQARLEIYEVDDAFFLRNVVGQRPTGVALQATCGDSAIPVIGSAELSRMVDAWRQAGHARVGESAGVPEFH
jgi:hypothetical protein